MRCNSKQFASPQHIFRSVQDPLAEMILAGTIHDGEPVHIAAGANGLIFNGNALEVGAEEPAPKKRSRLH